MNANAGRIVALSLALAILAGCRSAPRLVSLPATGAPTVNATFETTPAQRERAVRANQPVLLSGRAAVAPEGRVDSGWVTVRFVVATDGRVDAVEIVESSDSAFENAALTAVRSWRFETPAHAQRLTYTMEFPGIVEDHYMDTGSIQ